ncbi:helix-turn-helix XRE-family like protein [Tupanvirus deep ocean]|uniref:Helix-turn-helix XRE-family like protein n=2 Tax=Tupanvirus TaxID=2094720 RepID=A0AC62A795_9VIRU|nr:helix-turn-helix XRE-family like protein [Tupanvirus deep ocean]QKU33656.1 helix-turn-helix XRE-family like protein [Tupanvirus deep ocean]
MQAHVIFDEDNNGLDNSLDVEVEFEQKPTKSRKNKKGFHNPYHMNRNQVRMYHFRDARIYDHDINEPGWEVPAYVARAKYQQWLRGVRKTPGWENFRRPLREVTQEVEDGDGNVFIIRKLVPLRERTGDMVRRPNAGTNHKQRLMPQSRDKGVKVDDENFRPKMFTECMGKEISRLRHELGMTQAELGKKVNVDVATIRNIELGGIVTFNSEDTMVKSLAKVFGLTTIKYQE